MSRILPHASVLSCAVLAIAAGTAQAQLLGDPNFDALSIGTPPDNTAPAGAWQFPANYVAGLAGEFDPSNYTIVDTTSFDPSGGGNSLMLNMNDPTNNVHLTNLLTSVINETPGAIVHIKFRVWVAEAGAGAGAMYFGADMGGGGFTNTTDRGAQITWLSNGTFCYANGSGINTPLVTAFPVGEWQQILLHIRLDVDTYDVEWGTASIPMSVVGTNLPFRSAPINKIDRFSFAHFGATNALNHAFFDDFGMAVQLPPCYPDCNGDGVLNLSDFGCFTTKFALNDMYADCNGDGVLNLSDFGCFTTKFALGCP